MDDKRQRARELWKASSGQRALKDIAAELGVSEATLRTWKRRDGWGETSETQRAFRKDETQRETNRKRQASVNRGIASSIDNNRELTDVEKDFCLYFVQTYNATTAAWKTGAYGNRNSAKQNGWRMKHDPSVQAEIQRLKDIKRGGILADVDDLVELHMRIAFSDITDFVKWVYDPRYGANRMAVEQSDIVDGQLVGEVAETRNGFRFKLRDSKASMDFLERFFEANPMDKHKMAFDNARLALEKAKSADKTPDTTLMQELLKVVRGDGE